MFLQSLPRWRKVLFTWISLIIWISSSELSDGLFGRATGRGALIKALSRAYLYFYFPLRDIQRNRRGEEQKNRKNGKREAQVWQPEWHPVWCDTSPWPFRLAVKLPDIQDNWCEWSCMSLGINQLKSWVSANRKSSLYVQLNFCKSDVRASLKGTC